MSGYNPYRKSNGEFASKGEVGSVESKVEDDLREAQSSGDRDRVAQIESYAMDKLPESKLGKELLERSYGSAPSSVPSAGSSEPQSAPAVEPVAASKPSGAAESSTEGARPKPPHSPSIGLYEMSDEDYNPRTLKVGERFYDADGTTYTVTGVDYHTGASVRMTNPDGSTLPNRYRDETDGDLVISNRDPSQWEGLRKLNPPRNHLNTDPSTAGRLWKRPKRKSDAMGNHQMTDKRFEFDKLKAQDRFYDTDGNTYTVTGFSGDFAEIQMTQSGESPFRSKRDLPRDMVIEKWDRTAHRNLRKLDPPRFRDRVRSLFSR